MGAACVGAGASRAAEGVVNAPGLAAPAHPAAKLALIRMDHVNAGRCIMAETTPRASATFIVSKRAGSRCGAGAHRVRPGENADAENKQARQVPSSLLIGD